MDVETVGAVGAVAANPEFTIWGLFLQADIVVKAVMIFLLWASLWSWGIIFDKVLRLRSLTKKAEKFEEKFWSGSSLEELYDRVGPRPPDPMSSIFVAAMQRAQSAIDSAVSDLFKNATAGGDRNALALDIKVLSAAPDEVALRCLARCLKLVSGSPYGPRFESLNRLYGDLKPQSGSNPWTDRTLHGCQLRLANGILTISLEGKRG